MELVLPYRDHAHSLAANKSLLGLGALAWNLCSFSGNERKHEVDEAVVGLKGQDPAILRAMIEALIERKERLFPTDRRLMVDYEVTTSPNGYHVIVAFAGFGAP